MRGVTRFGVEGKLAPMCVGPFMVIERIGEVAYRLHLPAQLGHVHNVFHVSMLRKYTPDTSHVIEYGAIPLQEDVTYKEQPVKILAKGLKSTEEHKDSGSKGLGFRTIEKTRPLGSYSQRCI